MGWKLGVLLVLLSVGVNLWIFGAENEAKRLAELQIERYKISAGSLSNDGGETRVLESEPAGALVEPEGVRIDGAPSFTPTLVKPNKPLTLSTRFRRLSLSATEFQSPISLPLRPEWAVLSYLFLPGLILIFWRPSSGAKREEPPEKGEVSRSFVQTPLGAETLEGPRFDESYEHAPETPDELIYGRFVKGEFVGRGGMGEVYKCASCQPGDTRDYALKVMLADWGQSEDFRARFEREADICHKLVHPNLVRAYERGEKGDQLWMVMEFLEGVELQEWIEKSPPLPELLNLFVGLCEGLIHAHGRGVFHRDLKPENILVCSGRAVVTDFGLAAGEHYATITKTNTAMGTPIYMPPEQITGGQGSPQGDVYSLGCVLYQCLAGVVPFPDQDVLMILTQKLNGIPPAPLDPNRAPAALAEIVAKMMAANPLERYRSVEDVKEALQSFRAALTA